MKKAICDKLHNSGLRVTPQRLWVYEYLEKYKTHPDAEEVYEAMKKQQNSITRATVYNVLNSLVEKGLAIEVKLDGERTRFDADIKMHGHFKCEKCKHIYDFNVSELMVTGLEGFETNIKDVYFGGICNKCNK